MPSKIQLDENLWFLYICLKNSDYKAIDFNAVGNDTQLNAPAARMRYTRLRRAIEGGTLVGTHGTPFQRTPEKVSKARKKRKKPVEDQMTPNGDEIGPIHTRSGKCIIRKPRESTGSSEGAASDSSDEYDALTLAKHQAMVYEEMPDGPVLTSDTAKQWPETQAVPDNWTNPEGQHHAHGAPNAVTSLDETVGSRVDRGRDSYPISSLPKARSTEHTALDYERSGVPRNGVGDAQDVLADVK